MTAPNGWIATTVGGSSTFLTGFPFSSAKYSSSGFRLVRGSNVKRGVLDWSADITKYWGTDEASLRVFTLRDGDIVIAMDGALVGRSYARITSGDLPAYLVQRVARLRGTTVDQDLLHQWIGSTAFTRHVDDRKTHTAIPHISPRDIRDFSILVPSSSTEQKRIAAALTDADGLVVTLERLIAKKQAIKQAMTQQLLTGRTRLDGFSDPWVEVELSSVATGFRGAGLSKDSLDPAGRQHCVLYGELFTTYGRRISLVRSRTHAEASVRSRRGDVLVPGSTTTVARDLATASAIDSSDVLIGGDTNIIRPGARLDPVWLAYYITHRLGERVAEVAQGTTIKHLYVRDLLSCPVELPPRAEQRAVATALEDSELEITVARRRLRKALAVKAGMMQQLLTGRTRLLIKETAA